MLNILRTIFALVAGAIGIALFSQAGASDTVAFSGGVAFVVLLNALALAADRALEKPADRTYNW